MANSFKPNREGIKDILVSDDIRALMSEKTAEVAGNVSGANYDTHGGREQAPVPVRSESYTTDRAAGAVTLAHPAGIALEAKYGFLARAAEVAGFEWGRHSGPKGG